MITENVSACVGLFDDDQLRQILGFRQRLAQDGLHARVRRDRTQGREPRQRRPVELVPAAHKRQLAQPPEVLQVLRGVELTVRKTEGDDVPLPVKAQEEAAAQIAVYKA